MLQDVETHDPGRRAGLNRHCVDVRAEDCEVRVSAAGDRHQGQCEVATDSTQVLGIRQSSCRVRLLAVQP